MVIQFDNQPYIRDAENFSSRLAKIQKTKDSLKVLFGVVGLVVIGLAFSPVLVIIAWRLTIVTKNMLKEVIEGKDFIRNAIRNGEISFEEIIHLEEILKRILSRTETIVFFNEGGLRPLSKLIINLKGIQKEISEIEKIIHDSYIYKTEDLNLSEVEFKEYTDQFKDLADIWDHESCLADKNVVFNHKKELLNV